jgi:alanine-synthesizing transaminase
VAGRMDFPRIKRLPPYVFNVVTELMRQARRAGEDIIDLSMGNPDGPTPPHVVEKLIEAARKPANHRYSVSRGIYKLRVAICHLALGMLGPGDTVLCPSPTYPIHAYSVIIAGGDLRSVPLMPGGDFFGLLEEAIRTTWPKPKVLILNFPHNPTT